MRLINKYTIMLLVLLFATPLWADDQNKIALNELTLTLQTEQWVSTSTALVTVNINAAATDQGIEKIRADVMQKLSSMAQGDWHLVAFNRQQDKTGLENVQISAQARLPQQAMADLRSRAKNISKPGETFTVDNIQFTPSADELRAANQTLRANLYQQAKAELDAVNKIYPDQKYYVHKIDFEQSTPVAPMPMSMAMFSRGNGQANAVSSSAPLSVGNKIELKATVVLASTINNGAANSTYQNNKI